MSKKAKIILYLVCDLLATAFAWFICYPLFGIKVVEAISTTWYYFVASIVLVPIISYVFGLYSNIWKYASFLDALRILATALLLLVFNLVVNFVNQDFTIAWAFMVSIFEFLGLGASRFAFKLRGYFYNHNKAKALTDSATKVLIIGAGDAGAMLIREMKNSDKINMHPVCVLDDNTAKIGRSINGVKIVGKTNEVVKYAQKYNIEEIIIAMPSVSAMAKRKIIEECQKTSCKVMTVPGIYQFASGSLSVSSIQEVSVADLLGREQIKVNLDEIMGYIENKVVLVTGGGGSIGSELCRQIATHNPKQLIILDIYENNAYDIEQELLRRFPDINLLTLIASVRDKTKIEDVFKKYRPNLVFHAAAHKHVPLMETSPNEAIKNNVGGTRNVAEIAGKYGAERFILISTDKAVNPTNIMGASKRICEMIIQTMDKKYDTDYVAVRFGNVLGSNGSVIPLFKKQIKDGGPITVTHKDIVRYFMTIPEAVSLVLQAGAYANGGEIFVLDMGEPVKIYDLAVNLIKLSNLEPFKDIDICVTGLRPGEKLYEERLMAEEGLMKTENNMISIGKPIKFDEENLFSNIDKLLSSAKDESSQMKKLVHDLVPTYKVDERFE